MMVLLGLLMMVAGFLVATRLNGESRASHRAGCAVAAGTGAMLVLAGTVRPELTPLAFAALCVCLLWLAVSPPVKLTAAKSRDEVQR